jgi:predicted transcriptional regulator
MTGEDLTKWRESMRMTQLEFSQWLKPKRTPTQISNWERGKSPIPEWVDSIKANMKGAKK